MPAKTCEQRIDEELAGRIADFHHLIGRTQAAEDLAEPDQADATETEWDEFPLNVESKRVVCVLLSTGGPHDEFRCTVDADGDIERIEYLYQDWFDGAARVLSGSELDTAEQFLSRFVEAALLP